MANLCFNYLDITGSKEDLKKFISKFSGEYTDIIVLRITDNFDEEKEKNKLNISKDRIVEEVTKYFNGTPYMYIFYKIEGYSFNNFIQLSRKDFLSQFNNCSSKWGSSSDLYDFNISVNKEDNFVCTFSTNWNGAENVITKMAEEFPNLNFHYEYEEDSEQIAVVLDCYDNVVLRKEAPKDNNIEYRKFLKDNEMQNYVAVCSHCGCLLEESDIDEEICPNCDEDFSFNII